LQHVKSPQGVKVAGKTASIIAEPQDANAAAHRDNTTGPSLFHKRDLDSSKSEGVKAPIYIAI
jgi:hypothetical protein